MIDLKNIKKSDRVCVVVYGNIASGKSSFAKELVKLLPGFKYVCMDQVRIDCYLNGPQLRSIEFERKCEKLCENMLKLNNHIVYETTGVSQFAKSMLVELSRNFLIFYIFLDCPADLCLRRYQSRKQGGYFSIAPAFSDRLSIGAFINKVADQQRGMKKDVVLRSDRLSVFEMLKSIWSTWS